MRIQSAADHRPHRLRPMECHSRDAGGGCDNSVTVFKFVKRLFMLVTIAIT